MSQILGIGDNTIDIYVDHNIQFPGGNAINVSVFARRLGILSSYLGCWGKDECGKILQKVLSAEKIDISHVRHTPCSTSWTFVRHKGVERYFEGSQANFKEYYQLKSKDFEFIKSHQIVHSSIYSQLEDDIIPISKAAHIFSFDFSDKFNLPYLEKIAPHIDIAFLSQSNTSIKKCQNICRCIASYGPSIVIITRGHQSVIAFYQGKFYLQPIIPVAPVDTLGAGDGFIAAFLAARVRQIHLQKALLEAVHYASNICKHLGAFGYQTPIKTISIS